MNSISGFGALDALARFQSSTTLAPSASAAMPSRAWFDGSPVDGATLSGEVEAGAQGLGVAQHSERVLGHLLADERGNGLR